MAILGDDRGALVVAVDFGTTFSGVAFAFRKPGAIGSPDDIEVIKDWPGSNGMTSDKVPTEIAYTDGVMRWGFLLEEQDRRIRCIKLFLDQSQPLPSFVSSTDVELQLRLAHKQVADCAREYLGAVHEHVLNVLKRRYGAAFISSTKLEFILTLPAIWTDIAQHATFTAARDAGFANRLRNISEPEAAACYTLRVIQPNHLKRGNNMVVCDAGGGTVDLCSYRITSLEPLKLKESVVGSGGLCGASFLNMRFEEHVKDRIGKTKFDNMKKHNSFAWQTALERWESHIKRNFRDGGPVKFMVPFPGLANNATIGIAQNSMILSADAIREIFEPVVEEVLRLLQAQVDTIHDKGEQVSAILLVGGFGQSLYLLERVKQQFENESSEVGWSLTPEDTESIVVMQPPNAWTAVVRGAVMKGLEGSLVTDRMCRYNYGIALNSAFDASIHPKSIKYYDDHHEMFRASNVMEWYVRKGDVVAETRAVSFEVCRTFSGSDFPEACNLSDETDLLCNISEKAPVMKDQTLAKVCTLHADLSQVPRQYWKRKQNSLRKGYWQLDYTLEMTIDSADIHFIMKVKGNPHGAVSAHFNI